MNKYKREELENLILQEKMPYEKIGKIYNVSGNSIKKAAKRLGIKLPQRRKINKSEVFSKIKTNYSKIDILSDSDFIKIINSNNNWRSISLSLGYKNIVGSNTKRKILKRCSDLGIEIKIKKLQPTMLLTKKELISNRKNYQSYRSSIRRLAEITYKNSGKPLKCHICGYDKHVEIAHIKAVSDFDNDVLIKDINSKDNLIALCPNHHWEYDNGILKI